MKTLYSTPEILQNTDNDLTNIIAINNISDADSEEFDFDFDYDPNEMYYALANEDKLAG